MNFIYRQLQSFTMADEPTFVDNLHVAQRARELPGCIVECGVWKGGMMAGLASFFGDRLCYLFDTFNGIPLAQPIDGEAALAWQKDTRSPLYYNNHAVSPDYARRAMTMVGAERFHIVQGLFEETLPTFEPAEPIALLHLDADWYQSTYVCLTHLFDRVQAGGVIIIDDYYVWDGCSRAVHDFLSDRKSTDRLRSYQDRLCYIVKGGLPPNG